jgi:aminopeptidase YwaD
MVGSTYPFPLIADGDFDIPSVYMTDVEGDRLAGCAGSAVRLVSATTRIPAVGCNVVARKGESSNRRVVLFAHIDAQIGTPGAIDNASGVTTLLLLAELLADYAGKLGIEIVALNGEDYYSNPGEQQYLALNAGSFDSVVLGINLDGVGYHKGGIGYSLYGCSAETAAFVQDVMAAHDGIAEGELWYQGDHMLFVLSQRPALAFTSEQVWELMAEYIHTSRDCPDIVDPYKLANLAGALHDLLLRLDQLSA